MKSFTYIVVGLIAMYVCFMGAFRDLHVGYTGLILACMWLLAYQREYGN